ncbi:CDP-alcohol phosphatidyltransferase family protein [Oceanibacterium hippocampi]|uniref:CDP-diacylglycerol--glycerol-3-phosphate 3-phosphatidyltransferase n=1 Tax=Oceanibacterium hippocampi TaxID=745714 RepID=A0A1Y5SWP9_9PROT|nr:CDP-alcohol phosphatidyltransferase family protein [Oceanibacterium hippocampi]SLN48652.1 CDP-diacylglycerol--glycerol-3-phosphate 3-phosphatidyltransferase [Oceanibacterium hippocampi]
MNLPNCITLARLFSVPLIVWLMLADRTLAALAVFLLAGLSDAVDGIIAKRFNLVTDLGRFLDPVADKLLLTSVYVTLGLKGGLPTWLVILVVSRDLLIVGGALFSIFLGMSMRVLPSFISKLNTLLQILLAALALAHMEYADLYATAFDILVGLVAATTVLSGAGYLRYWISLQER